MNHHSSSTLRLVTDHLHVRAQARIEVANYRARQRVRCVAVAHGHQLGFWKEDPTWEDAGVVACRSCGAMASLDLRLGDETISEALRTACPSVPFALTRPW